MTAAAFQATYSDWRIVKGRKVVQVVFELPLEQADTAYQVLGGMPIAAHEVWCGIARLKQGKEGDAIAGVVSPPSPVVTPPRSTLTRAPSGADKRPFAEMPLPQQAGMLSQDRAFRLFLAEKFDMPIPDPDEAADVIRHHCKIKSRADIKSDNVGWSELVLGYQVWKRAAEIVPA
jgi:hypothetical protein